MRLFSVQYDYYLSLELLDMHTAIKMAEVNKSVKYRKE